MRLITVLGQIEIIEILSCDHKMGIRTYIGSRISSIDSKMYGKLDCLIINPAELDYSYLLFSHIFLSGFKIDEIR